MLDELGNSTVGGRKHGQALRHRLHHRHGNAFHVAIGCRHARRHQKIHALEQLQCFVISLPAVEDDLLCDSLAFGERHEVGTQRSVTDHVVLKRPAELALRASSSADCVLDAFLLDQARDAHDP